MTSYICTYLFKNNTTNSISIEYTCIVITFKNFEKSKVHVLCV